MHISVHCPSCGSQYQVDPGLRGLRMRCPNPACRQVFQVWEEPELGARQDQDDDIGLVPIKEDYPPGRHPQPPADKPRKTGSGAVGDMVPILDAEVVEESASPPRRGAAPGKVPVLPPEVVEDRRSSPPRERRSGREVQPAHPTASPSPAPAAPSPSRGRQETPRPPEPEQVAAPLPAWHSPPPVRRPGALAQETPDSPEPEPALEVSSETPPRADELLDLDLGLRRSTGRRRALWMVGILVVLGGLVVGVVAAIALNTLYKKENQLAEQAFADYSKGGFANAARTYQNLAKDFPRSDKRPFYLFMGDLSELRELVNTLEVKPGDAQTRVERFLDTYKGDTLLGDHIPDVQDTLLKLALRLTESAEQQLDSDLLARAKKTLDERRKYSSRGAAPVEDNALLEKMASVEAALVRRNKHERVSSQLKVLLAEAQPTVDTVRKARDLVEDSGFEQDQELKEEILRLEAKVRELVRYVAHAQPAAPNPPGSSSEHSILVVPRVGGASLPPGSARRVVLALVQGVLYALDQENGDVHWAIRVGIDTTTLPVRLPATPSSPELFLVLAADGKTLLAVTAEDGSIHWQQSLSAPCLGRPVVVGQHAYVPTYSDQGRVYEIETVKGNLLGYFELRQPLSMGGTRQEGTDLIYFAGDSDSLYVLDPQHNPKRCVAVLHTGHPSGSLRSEPIIINRTDPLAPGNAADQTAFPSYLILNQAAGLDQTILRVFSLPINRPDPPPLLQPEPRIRGWSWFPPYYDGEKLAFMTDVGVFGLYGINQVRNEDPALFSQFGKEECRPVPTSPALGLAQVVHADENDFWIVANGLLQRYHFDLYHQKMVRLWSNPPHVGLPVHAAQSDDMGRTLFLVSQDPLRQIYLASALDADKGKILWQRQLGLQIQGDPLRLGNQVLAVDHGGGLFSVDPARSAGRQVRDWQVVESIEAKPLPEGVIQSYLLPAGDGTTVYQVSCHELRTQLLLTVRKYQVSAQGPVDTGLQERSIPLTSPLLTAPALCPQSLLLPSADGVVRRLTLPINEQPQLEDGPNWRSVRADEGARGYVVAIGPDEFLTTDGSSGLTHWRWPMGMMFTTVPEKELVNGEIPPTVRMPARIVAPPVVLPRDGPDDELRVCVATYGGTLTLLAGPDLQPVRFWSLGGTCTNGPFVRGQHIGCVLDRSRLVWIDPKDKVVWDHKLPGAGIVGQPQEIEGLLLVADASGDVYAYDPGTGAQVGAAYVLKTSAAAGTPVAFGAGTALIPLTDGTVFLLDLKAFRKASPSPPGP